MNNIIQWNCQGIYAKWEELNKLIYDFTPSCIALQELILKRRQLPTLKNYTGYSKQTGQYGGVAIYIHQNVPQMQVQLNTTLQAVAARVFLERNYTVCSIYISPGENLQQSDLINILSQLPSPFLLMGDFNARHPLWGDVTRNQKGSIIENIIGTTNISILNTGNPTSYHVQTNSLTCIDLTLCSATCSIEFTWRTDSDLRGSDHYPIIIETTKPNHPKENTYKWNTSKAKWLKFTTLSKYIAPLNSIDESLEAFLNHINKAADLSIPKTISTIKAKKSLPWWTQECKIAVTEHKRACRIYQRSPTLNNRFERNRTRAIRQKTLRQARRTSLIGYISSINSQTPSKQVWNRIRKISGKSSGYTAPNLKEAGELIGDPQRVADLLAQFFAGISNPAPLPKHLQQTRTELDSININFLHDKIDNNPYNKLFTIN